MKTGVLSLCTFNINIQVRWDYAQFCGLKEMQVIFWIWLLLSYVANDILVQSGTKAFWGLVKQRSRSFDELNNFFMTKSSSKTFFKDLSF